MTFVTMLYLLFLCLSIDVTALMRPKERFLNFSLLERLHLSNIIYHLITVETCYLILFFTILLATSDVASASACTE